MFEYKDILAPVPIAEMDIKGSIMLIARNNKAEKATIEISVAFKRDGDKRTLPHRGQTQL